NTIVPFSRGAVVTHHPSHLIYLTFLYSTLFVAGDLGGSSAAVDVAVIGGVIAAVAIVLICLLIVMLRYMYRHKGTYHTNEAKGTEFAESADAALKNDPALQEAVDESKKEYFI
uniref:Glycophorin C (Gerbich blood group) n=1 Tax=Gopherus evgoodei TaxID=1825980 RepID=A0A8C4Y9N3_9SAUR